MTPLKKRLAGIRPEYVGVDPVDRVVYEPGEIAQCDLWFPETQIPVGAGQERVLPVLVMTLGFSRFTVRDDDPVAAGRGHPGRDVAADLPGRAGAPRRWSGTGSRRSAAPGGSRAPAAAFAGTSGDADQAGAAAGPGVQGHGRARQRLPGDLVPARPHVRLPGGLQRPARRLADRGRTPARSGRSQGRPVDLLETDTPAMLALPPVDPPVGLTHRVRLGRDYYVRVDTVDYSVDPRCDRPVRRRDRHPDAVAVRLRRAGRRPPRPVLGQARRDHRPRPRRDRRAMRQALAEDRATPRRPRPATTPTGTPSRCAPCPTTTPCSASTSPTTPTRHDTSDAAK